MINVHLKASELVKAGFAFGLGLQLSSAVVVFTTILVKEMGKKSKNTAENEEKIEE